MVKQSDSILAESLVRENLISEGDVKQALVDAESSGKSLSTFFVKSGLLKEDQILSILSKHLHIDRVDLKTITIDQSVVEKIPVKFVWYYKFMPVSIEGKILTLAAPSPLDVKIQDEIRVNLGLEPKVVLASEDDIIEALKKYYGLAADTIDRIMTKGGVPTSKTISDRSLTVEDLEKQSEDASVIKLVNQIILEAYKKRATDIHIEPYRNKVRFRYRIDGILVDANLPDEIKHFLAPILSRIKIMSNLSIVERRLPQDGSAIVRTKDQTLDLRVSTIPTPNGESMVIRILPTKVMLFSLERLGINERNTNIFRELIKKPHGIIFVTGPTGSGKTTTLYACLNEISSDEKKIITIEDPVEYEMSGITQIQANPKVNLDFARGLRSILRHDPDIIMVGEVRDLETAEIAIRTALTGHLVFSTLHTNDAASGITRIIDMGLEPFLVASSVEAFVAQRLIRIICPNCKEEVRSPMLEIKEEIKAALGIKNIDSIKIYQGRGCDQCNRTGFYGRTAIHEILVVNDIIRAAIIERPRTDYIRRIAIDQGMTTLRKDGWQKVIDGITTPMEVINVTDKEELVSIDKNAEDKQPENSDESERKERVNDAITDSYRVIPHNIFSQHNANNARTYKRVDAKIKVQYKIFHPESKDPHALTVKGDDIEHATETTNISAGGLLFISHAAIEVGSILDLKIQAGQERRTVQCLAKVCRVEEDELTMLFRIAVYYLDISSSDRVVLNDLVRSVDKEQE